MRKILILSGLLFVCYASFAQTNVVEFLKGGKADANKLFQVYLEPYAFALGDGLNNGWYSSAETHKLFGFDLTVTLSAIQIPDESKTYDISKLGLKNISVESGGNIAPTIAGANTSGPKMVAKDDKGNKIASFSMPNGAGLDMVPVPMIQLGFGLIPHTDLIGRFVPEMKYDNEGDEMKLGFWGAGVKHNFMEWMPGLKTLPFDAALFGSYSQVSADSELSFSPADYGDQNLTVTFTSGADQFLKLNTTTIKYGLILSKKIGVLTVFGGLGQSSSETTIDLIGKFPVVTTAQGGGLVITNEDALIDPIALQFETKNISIDAGLRLKVAFLSIFGSYNKAQYTSYNVGLSLGAR